MKRTIYGVLPLAFGAILLISGCRPKNSALTDRQKSATAAQIQQMADSLTNAWNALQYGSYMNLFSEDVQFGYESMHFGYPELETIVKQYMSTHTESRYIWDTTSIQVLRPEVASFSVSHD